MIIISSFTLISLCSILIMKLYYNTKYINYNKILFRYKIKPYLMKSKIYTCNISEFIKVSLRTFHAYTCSLIYPRRHRYCTWRCAQSERYDNLKGVGTIVRDDFRGDHLDSGLAIPRILSVVNKANGSNYCF